jgi:heptosyltransferase-3
MRFLFTKLRHIGDNLLITPILVATKRKFPDAEIWVVVRRGTEGILAGCPEIDHLLTTARPEAGKRTWNDFGNDLTTLGKIITIPFDYAFELGDNDRGRTLVMASRAVVRVTHGGDEEKLSSFWRRNFTHVGATDRDQLHQVEMDYLTPQEVLGLSPEIPPLCFDPSATMRWKGAEALNENFAVLHAATRWHCKSWPQERWRAALKQILEFTPQVIVSCGPSTQEIAEAEELCAGFGNRVITTGGRASWRELAWMLERARYYVGVDTAAMHLAAAMQCPIVSLFGHSVPSQFGPWKCPHAMIAPAGRKRGESGDPTPGLPDNDRMLQITVEEVVAACRTIYPTRDSTPTLH